MLTFQMPIDRLNAVVQQTAGLGETGQTFLVGDDRLMRTDSRFSDESTILAQRVDNAAVDGALRSEHGTVNAADMNGNDAIVAYTYVDFHGTRWAMIAEMATHEILAPAETPREHRLAAIISGCAHRPCRPWLVPLA